MSFSNSKFGDSKTESSTSMARMNILFQLANVAAPSSLPVTVEQVIDAGAVGPKAPKNPQKIPYGEHKPTGKDAETLERLGFDLSKMTHEEGGWDKYYYLELPPHLNCKGDNWRSDMSDYEVYFGDQRVLSSAVTAKFYQRYVSFQFNTTVDALINNLEFRHAKVTKKAEQAAAEYIKAQKELEEINAQMAILKKAGTTEKSENVTPVSNVTVDTTSSLTLSSRSAS